MKFFVSRQLEWPDANLLVEVVCGGQDFANPGMLTVRWKSLGEGQEFTNPVEAAEAAIKIRDAWKAVEVEEIEITFGATGGMTLSLPRMKDKELLAKAEEILESLPKCAQCSEVLGKETFTHDLSDEDKFCSSNCSEVHYSYCIMDDHIHGEEDVG